MARKDNEDAKKLLLEKYTIQDSKTASGAEVFIQAVNGLIGEVTKKAEKETEKPKYRFLNTYNENESIGRAARIDKMIAEHNFKVSIFEDLECKDVTKGSKYTIRISNTSGVYVDIDLLYYEEKIKDFEFDATEYIANNLAKIIGSINNEVRELAPLVTEYIACAMYTRKLYKLRYNKIGWEYYIGEHNVGSWIFKYDQIYSKNRLYLKGHLPMNLSDGLGVIDLNKKEKEKENKWVAHTIKLLNNHVYDGLILGAGISGLVRQLLPYTKENNINMNIVGEPASGKSTICHYLLSIFGNPERIEGSFIDTDNSMEETRAKRPVLPYVLDERMLKMVTESDTKKQQTILTDIFREYEGKVKERVGKQYEETSGDRIYGPVISSSVESMMKYVLENKDLGQYRRFIEFDIGTAKEGKLFENAKEATETENIAYDNYGYGITIIIDYMLSVLNNTIVDKDTNEISNEATHYMNRFNALKDSIETKLSKKEKEVNHNKVKGITSSANRFALIIMSYQILREALLYYTYKLVKEDLNIESIDDKNEFNKIFASENSNSFVEFEENSKILKDYTDEMLNTLINNLVDKMKGIRRTSKEQVRNIYDYIIKNRSCFKEGEKFTPKELQELIEAEGEYLGFCIISEDKKRIELYTPEEFYFPQFIKMPEISEPEKIKQYIKYLKANNIKGKEEAVRYGMDKLGTVNYSTTKGKENFDRSYKTINGETVTFYKFIIEPKDTTEDESKEGNQNETN